MITGIRERLSSERLLAPVDGASVAVFRIGFGLLSAWEIWRAFDGNLIAADYETPRYLFRWWAFEWVMPLPGRWLYFAFAATGVAALLVAAGLFYRTAAVVHVLGISYWILMEKAGYLNHRYLTALIGFLLVFVPAHSLWSVDARRKPWVRSQSLPDWTVQLLRFQVGVPYFFSGVAKLNFDWLVRAEPLRTWLSDRTDFPLIGSLFTSEFVVRLMSLGSAALDLSMPFLLLNRRTRAPAFGFAVAFHFLNARLFELGLFPWLMIASTTIFFDPDWPRRIFGAMRRRDRSAMALVASGFVLGFAIGGFLPTSFSIVMATTGGAGVALFFFHLPERRIGGRDARSPEPSSPWVRFSFPRRLGVALGLWAAVQILLPLRQVVIPGNVNWTEEGQRFAWHLLLQSKAASVAFHVTEPASGRTWNEDLRRHLNEHQISKLNDPDMILQFAHHLAGYYRERDMDVEVRVDAVARLNFRDVQQYIDPNVDLASIERPYLPPAAWIVPLEPYR